MIKDVLLFLTMATLFYSDMNSCSALCCVDEKIHFTTQTVQLTVCCVTLECSQKIPHIRIAFDLVASAWLISFITGAILLSS